MLKIGLEHIPEPYRSVASSLLTTLQKMLGNNLISILVYGSVARGDARKDSDLDVLIVAEGLPNSRLERSKLFINAESQLSNLLDELSQKGYSITISPIIKTRSEATSTTPLYLDMVEDAIIIYDKENFIQQILTQLKEKLKTLGAEKVKLGKKWYWRLKKDFKFGEVITI